ncbi:MAG: hypothetical protein ACLT9P_03535 [Evtepia gabavorous]
MAVKEKFKNRAGKLTGEGEKANLLQKIKRKLIDFFSGRCTIEKYICRQPCKHIFILPEKPEKAVEPPRWSFPGG